MTAINDGQSGFRTLQAGRDIANEAPPSNGVLR